MKACPRPIRGVGVVRRKPGNKRSKPRPGLRRVGEFARGRGSGESENLPVAGARASRGGDYVSLVMYWAKRELSRPILGMSHKASWALGSSFWLFFVSVVGVPWFMVPDTNIHKNSTNLPATYILGYL